MLNGMMIQEKLSCHTSHLKNTYPIEISIYVESLLEVFSFKYFAPFIFVLFLKSSLVKMLLSFYIPILLLSSFIVFGANAVN